MQPVQTNPSPIVLMVILKMIAAAGAKETELQGASSVMHGKAFINALMGAIQGET